MIIIPKRFRKTRAQLRRIPARAPTWRVSEVYQPVQFGKFVDALHAELERREIPVREERWGTANYYVDNAELFGSIDLGDWSLGIELSNAQKHKPRFYCGKGFVDWGYVYLRRTLDEHSELQEMEEVCSEVIGWWLRQLEAGKREMEEYQQTKLTAEDWRDLLLEVDREGLLSLSRLGAMAKHAEGAGNLWQVYRAFARAVALESPREQLDRLLRFHEMAKKVIDLTPCK